MTTSCPSASSSSSRPAATVAARLARSASEGLERTDLPLGEIPGLPAIVRDEAHGVVMRRVLGCGPLQPPSWLRRSEVAVHRLAFWTLVANVFKGIKPGAVCRREIAEAFVPTKLRALAWVYDAMPGDDPLNEFALVLWAHLSGVVGVELQTFIPIDVDGREVLRIAREAWAYHQLSTGAAEAPQLVRAAHRATPPRLRFTIVEDTSRGPGYVLAVDGAPVYEPDLTGGFVSIKALCPTELSPHHWLACALDRLNRPEADLRVELRLLPPEAPERVAELFTRTLWIQGRPFVFPAQRLMGAFLALLATHARLPSAPALSACDQVVWIRGADKAGRLLLVEDAKGVWHLRLAAAPHEAFIRLGADVKKPTFQAWGTLLKVLAEANEDYRVTVRTPATADGYPAHVEVQAQANGDALVFELDTQQGGVTLALLIKALAGLVTVADLAAFPVRAERVVSLGGVAIVTIWPEWFETPGEGAALMLEGQRVLRWMRETSADTRLGAWAQPWLGGRRG